MANTEEHAAQSSPHAFRRILAAVDDSSRALDVVTTAAEIARIGGGALRLYHAVSVPQEFPPAAAMPTGDALPEYMRKHAAARLDSLAAAVRDVPCETFIDESHRAWRAILDAADAYDADLIVLGGHRHERLERMLGTTAANVVNFAARNVLVVRSRAKA
jgi:nucleotide-binding universal stress UspA family protein